MKLPISRHVLSIYPLIAFAVSLTAYWLTVDPGPSYWDCPEYLLTALLLEVGHPPGNPGWSLTHRVASLFFCNPETQTLAVNMMAGFFTALSVMILCSVSITLMRWIFLSGRKVGKEASSRKTAIGITSLCGSLCFAFSDSAWYSAVEAEVYAMSLFLSSLTIWMAIKWAFAFSRSARDRWMIALFYVIGFSLGVHQLNLLVLPGIALIMECGTRGKKHHIFLRRIGAFAAGCVAVGVILKGIMPGAVKLAEQADIYFVNSLGLPFWSGAITIWASAIVISTTLALIFQSSRFVHHRYLAVGFWSLTLLAVGFSVYIIIPIRAWANPPVNEGDPSSVVRFADYLERRQYGSAPLLYGRTPESRIMRVERMQVSESGDTTYDYSWNSMKVKGRDMRPMIRRGHIPDRSRFLTDEDKAHNARLARDTTRSGYVVAGFRTEPVYTPELNMLMPRIHSGKSDNIKAYGDWTGMTPGNMVRVRISEAIDSMGRHVPMRDSAGNPIEKYASRPTYLQSLSYLLGYQIGYMYLRYLMWNFSGRQNDVPSTGEIDHGNFITGIGAIDNIMLGDQSLLPDELGKANAGHNVYWGIPFLLGIIGIMWMFCSRRKSINRYGMRTTAWVSLVLFFMTGVAIVVYLNQSPGEPRERDYTFLGNYWTFSLWIGFGMLYLVTLAHRLRLRMIMMAIMAAIPVWILAQNFDDHNRSGRHATLDYAENLLMSLDRDAILFVDGDNYIFPLWYAQEVMGIRRDVSIVCYSYLGSDWYVVQLMTPGYDRDGISMTGTKADIALGNYNALRLQQKDGDTIAAGSALLELYHDMSPIPTLRHRWLKIGNDSTDGMLFDLLSIPGKNGGSLAGLRELATIDIVATNAASRYPRPVYWHQNLSPQKYIGFYPYTRPGLFTRKLDLSQSSGIEESLNALPDIKSGGIDRMAYLGPDITSQAEQQRASLIRLAGTLSDSGRHNLALYLARMAMVYYPSATIPYSIRHHADSAYFEARELSRILRVSGEVLSDTAAIREAALIEQEDSLRTQRYQRYRRSIPASRRHAISPRTNNHTISQKKTNK